MSFVPNVYEENEGNPWIERLTPVLFVVAIGLVIFFQQFLRQEHGATLVTPLPEVQKYEVARKPEVGNLVVASKFLLKEREFAKSVRLKKEAADLQKDLANLEKDAVSRVDRFRFAILSWEFTGAAGAVERLEKLQTEAEPNGDLANEIAWMLDRYRQVEAYEQYQQAQKDYDESARAARTAKKKVPDKPAILKAPAPKVEHIDPEFRVTLIARHGFFGELALTQGPDRDEAARHELLGGFMTFIGFEGVMTIIEWIAALFGAVMLVVFYRRMRDNPDEIGLEDPRAPTTVYLEIFTIFALFFGIWTGIQVLLLGGNSQAGFIFSEFTIWMAPLCLLWGRARGVTWGDMLHDLGLHKGAGIFREVLVGIAAACAAMRIEGIINVIIAVASGGDTEASPVKRPPGMFEVPDEVSWGLVWVSTLGAVLWAPLVEETFFRGALQRWLRVRMGWLPTVGIVSLVFGFYHPYELSGLISVAFAGISFGLVREWRKCLIAPMVMHAIHNGLISIHEVGFLQAVN